MFKIFCTLMSLFQGHCIKLEGNWREDNTWVPDASSKAFLPLGDGLSLLESADAWPGPEPPPFLTHATYTDLEHHLNTQLAQKSSITGKLSPQVFIACLAQNHITYLGPGPTAAAVNQFPWILPGWGITTKQSQSWPSFDLTSLFRSLPTQIFLWS